MNGTPRILIVMPFRWGRRKLPTDPVRSAFENGLHRGGMTTGRDVLLDLIGASDVEIMKAELERRMESPPDLIYACGTTAMSAALDSRTHANLMIPILYRGAHPEHEGMLQPPFPCVPQIGGIVARIPLLEDFRQFRALQHAFPQIRNVYCLFARQGAFFESARSEHVTSQRWVESCRGGRFPALSKLADLIDARFFECVYGTVNELKDALQQIPSGCWNSTSNVNAVILTCVDCHHVEGAARAIMEIGRERATPVVSLSRLDFYGDCGPMLSFENDWVGASEQLGRWAAEVLACVVPSGKWPVYRHDRFQVRYYARFAESVGMRIPEATLERFEPFFGECLLDDQISDDDFTPDEACKWEYSR